MTSLKNLVIPLLLAVGLATSGCGVKQLQADLESANSQIADLETQLTEAQKMAKKGEAAAELAERRLERYKDLAAKLRAAYGDEGLVIKIRSGRMVVQLPNSILFDSGKVELKDEGKETLAKFAGVLKEVPNRRFLVAGHTDNVAVKPGARFKNNWELSALRATEAAVYLESQGVKATQFGAAGFGENLPETTNDTDEGKAMNRRLEIIIMPMADEIPPMPKGKM
jgi:chemotaxis protein MotB